MNIYGIPIFYLVPLLVFGPIFFLVLYNFGLKNLINPPPEIKAERRRREGVEKERKSKIKRFPPAGKKEKSITPLGWVGQAVFYLLFAAFITYLSNNPVYQRANPDEALIKLSLSHFGKRKGECHKRTSKELSELAPNMRKSISCPRERWPVMVKFEIDGNQVFEATEKPSGLSSDGSSTFYETFLVSSGEHLFSVWVSDDGGQEYVFKTDKRIMLKPGQSLVIGLHKDKKEIYFK
ncbi:MAG: hypothetical protein OEY85_09540 [Rhodospirillales bacterium]|nr:hypothetical protein [Rhodospirillales bacterium]